MLQTNIAAREQTTAKTSGQSAVRRARRARLLRPVLMVGGVLIVLIGGLVFWVTGGRYVSSDDTYVDAAKVSLSTDVPGLVAHVDVRDNSHVDAGQVLFSLAQPKFDIAVAAAQAQMAQAVLDINGAKRAYAGALDEIEAQKIQIANDQANLHRYASVVASGGVNRATYEDQQFKVAADQAKLTQLQDQAGVQLAKLNGNPTIPAEQVPEYQQAKSQLDNALRDKANSVVKAPFSGYVTLTEQLQPGMYLPAGTAAFGLVSDTDVWITAQPKESELTWVRPGQTVDITVDAYPGQKWTGIVESISPASGSEFSILPAQNSSGNWVKVVQRVPLRVKITGGPDGLQLRDGMSAEISVDTKHHRHLSDLF
jgi:membrane fusion protein (multidrug efflux system)